MTSEIIKGHKRSSFIYEKLFFICLGWMITFSSVMFIPIVAFFKIAQEKGSLMTVRYTVDENIIATIKMRNNFCYSL